VTLKNRPGNTLVAAIVLFVATGTARAEEVPPPFGGEELAVCDANTAERIRFIDQRLAAGQPYAQNWWTFFTMFYGTGAIYSFVQGALKDDSGNRADSFVSGSKALFGTARLLLAPLNAKLGAGPMHEISIESRAECEQVLTIGEELLRKNAKESEQRYSWKAHLSSVLINVAGALIVAEGYDNKTDGWKSAGIGIAVGEVFTWSQPWNGTSDLEDYEREFNEARAPITWKLTPTGTGLRLLARF
jgi:hypothetical protein